MNLLMQAFCLPTTVGRVIIDVAGADRPWRYFKWYYLQSYRRTDWYRERMFQKHLNKYPERREYHRKLNAARVVVCFMYGQPLRKHRQWESDMAAGLLSALDFKKTWRKKDG